MERICRDDGIEGTCGVKRTAAYGVLFSQGGNSVDTVLPICATTTVEFWESVGWNCCSGVLHEGVAECRVWRLVTSVSVGCCCNPDV